MTGRWITIGLLLALCGGVHPGVAAAGAESAPVERSAYIEAARTAMQIGNAKVALARFNAADALAPLTPKEELERARVLLRLGQTAVAIATLQRMAAEHPEDADFQVALTQALLASGKVEEARALIAEPEEQPGPPTGASEDAESTAAKRNWTIDDLEAALERNPGDLWTTRALGEALAKAGRSAEAAPYLLAALVQLPNDIRLRQEVGVNLLRAGHPKEAAEELRRVVQAEPENRYARDRLAEALLRSGQDAAALAEIRKLEAGGGDRGAGAGAGTGRASTATGNGGGNRKTAPTEERKALAQARLARKIEQLAPLEELYGRKPTSRRLGLTLAQAYLRLGTAENAATVLDELIAAGQQDAAILRLSVQAREKAGLDTTEPLEALHLLLPGDLRVARSLARAYAESGRPARAAALWRELLDTTGSDQDLHALVRSAWAAGDTATTAALGPRAVAVAPQDAVLRRAVREALLASGAWQEALALTPMPEGGTVANALREAESRPPAERLPLLERLWDENPLPPVGRALARARVATGRFDAALAGLDRVVPPLREPEDELLRAAAYLGLGAVERAAPILDRWASTPDAERPAGWWRLQAERLLQERGAVDAAITLLAAHWREEPGNPAAARRLAELLAWRALHQTGSNTDGAADEALFAALRKAFAEDLQIRADQVRWLAATGAWDTAWRELRTWPPGHDCARLRLRADLAAAAHWPVAAGTAADSLVAAGNCSAGLPAARALAVTEKRRAANQLLRARIEEHPEDPLAALELARLNRIPTPLLTEWPQPAAADSTVMNPIDHLLARAWAIPADATAAARAAATAIDSLCRIHADSPALNLAAAQMWIRADSLESALAHYRTLLEFDPGRLDWALAEARLLTRLGASGDGKLAWQALVKAAPERPDIRAEAEAAQKRLRGDLRGARKKYAEILERWPNHPPARSGLVAVDRQLSLEREKRRLAMGILAPRPGAGMPLEYLYPASPPATRSSYRRSSRHGRNGGVDIGVQSLEIAAGSWRGIDLRLAQTSFFAPREAEARPTPSVHRVALSGRYPPDLATASIGLVADVDYSSGAAGLSAHTAGGAAVALRQDSQSVLVAGVERRRWAETLEGLNREIDRESAFMRIGTSVLDDRFRLEIHAAGSRLDDDNAFWQGDGRIAIALGPAYQSLLIGVLTEVKGFHHEVPEYFSPARFGRLLTTLGWRHRPLPDDLSPSLWHGSIEAGFGVEQALTIDAPPSPVGTLDLNLARPLGPLLLQARCHLLAAADSRESQIMLTASYPR